MYTGWNPSTDHIDPSLVNLCCLYWGISFSFHVTGCSLAVFHFFCIYSSPSSGLWLTKYAGGPLKGWITLPWYFLFSLPQPPPSLTHFMTSFYFILFYYIKDSPTEHSSDHGGLHMTGGRHKVKCANEKKREKKRNQGSSSEQCHFHFHFFYNFDNINKIIKKAAVVN